MAATRSVRLTEAPAAAATKRQRSARSVPEPNRQMYGVFGPGYASYLANTAAAQGGTDSAALAALNASTLQGNAEAERAEYAAMLTRAQDIQQKLAEQEQAAALQELIIEQTPTYVREGIGQALEGYGVFGEGADVIRRGDRSVLNKTETERLKDVANVADTLSGTEYAPEADWVSKMLVNPEADPTAPYGLGIPVAPGAQQKLEEYKAHEGRSFEQELQLALAKKSDGDSEEDDIGEVKLNYGATGEVPTLEYNGTPDQVARARQKMIDRGFDPNTGEKLNPNAGTQGGGVPAKPAAKIKTTEQIHVVPADGFFASDKISSKKGMRKHPILGVNRMHEGDDYAYPKGTPIPAERNGTVLFSGPVKGYGNQVKVRYEDGSVVSYSHNASNAVQIGQKVQKGQVIGKVGSTGQSTGPHVHRQIHSQGNPEKVYATRLKQHPLVVDVKVVDDKTLVTMRDGTQRVYQKGRRIGG